MKYYGVRIQKEQSMKLCRNSKINKGALKECTGSKLMMVSGLGRMEAEKILRRIFQLRKRDLSFNRSGARPFKSTKPKNVAQVRMTPDLISAIA